MVANTENKKRVSVTEDDPSLLNAFKIILEREGYEVEVLNNGQELINYRDILPDLFILDKQLSGVDGLALCKHLKSQEHTRNIPVMMISASPNIKYLSIEAGADDFLEKPFELQSLLHKVRALLKID